MKKPKWKERVISWFDEYKPATKADILRLENLIMPTNQETLDKLNTLQSKLNEVQTRVQTAVDALDDLLELAEKNAVSQEVLDKVQEIHDDLEGTSTTPSDGSAGTGTPPTEPPPVEP